MRTIILLLLLLPVAARAAGTTAPDPFVAVKAQIDSLLEHRRQPPPFSPAAENPFQRPGMAGVEVVPVPGTTGPTVPRASGPLDQIHRVASLLRISGTVNLGGRLQVIINSVPCEEGKVLPVRDGEILYRVLIKRLAPASVTIEVGDAELAMPLR